MGICDTLDDWDDIGPSSERFTELRDFVNELLSEWGFDPPDWSDQPHPEQDGAPGMYDSDTGTIHLDPDFLGDADASDAVNVAIHEGLHARTSLRAVRIRRNRALQATCRTTHGFHEENSHA